MTVEDTVDPDLLESIRGLIAPEDDTILFARERARQSADPPSVDAGSLLRWLARACDAHTVVEVGSTGGVSGLCLLRGLAEGGMLTSLEPDPHTHALAVSSYAEADVTERIRSILGDPLTILPRLSDGAYDLVVLQAHSQDLVSLLEHAGRLLRPGGVLVVRGITDFSGDATLDTIVGLLDATSLTAAVLPIDDGVLVAVRDTAAAAQSTD